MRNLVILLLSVVTVLSAAAGDFTDRFEKRSVFGKWIDIDKGKIIEINSKTKFSFERLDNDLIILRKGSKKNYLKRIGTAKTNIKGRVVQDIGAKSFASVAHTKVLLRNVNDRSIVAHVKTDKLGYFSDKTLPSGDYFLTVSKRKARLKVRVSLVNNSESLGTFVLSHKKAAVFKSKLSMAGTFVVSNRQRYKAYVTIENYGNKNGQVCYAASLKDKDIKELRFAKGCKNISAGKSIRVPVYLSFNPISINSIKKQLHISLKDRKGHVVVEKHPFKVYKNFFNLKIKTANKAMKGYVVLPGHEVKTVDVKKGKLSLPKLSDEEYKLILANTDPKKKTAYVVDIGAEEKLIRGAKKKKRVRRRGKRRSIFSLKQSIARYPDVGDIAVYSFSIPDGIVMHEDDKTLRVRFGKKDRLGDAVIYKAMIANNKLASVSYKNGHLVIKPKPGKNGVTTITLKNSKRYGNVKKKLFTLRIKAVNNKPRIVSKPVKTALENKSYSYYLKGVDAETKHLSKKALRLPKWLKFSKKKGLLWGKPGYKDAGSHKVVLRLSDEEYHIDQSFTIKVIALDKAPQSQNAYFTVKEDEVLKSTLKAKVRKGKLLSFALVVKPKNGKITLAKKGAFVYTPKANYYGNDSFTIKAMSEGKSTQSVVNLNITAVNDAPTASDISIDAVGTGPVEIDWIIASKAQDADQDKLSLEINTLAKLGSLELNEESMLVYIPYADTRGDDRVTLTIHDANGLSKRISLTLFGISRQLTPRILQTGQTVIYHPFDDATYKKSLIRSYALDLSGQVVKDKTLKKSWYVGKKSEKISFKQAHDYCQDLEVSGHKGWRLPEVKELVMITDKGTFNPAIDANFKNIYSDYYWTSTAYGKRANYRWTVYLDYGNDYFAHEKTKNRALCVRDGIDFSSKQAQYDSNNTQTAEIKASVHLNKQDLVWDKEHELVWEDRDNSKTATWVGAIKICEQLRLYGRSNWRLPNFNELYSISNHSENNRSVPYLHETFKHAQAQAYWTSTSGANDHDRAWGLSFKDGSDFSYDKTEQIYVRCVRDQ